jgi:Tfp pilus assembly protein PilO
VTSIQKLDLSPRALVITLVLTIAVLAGATWFLLVAPKHSQVSNLNSQIQSAQSQLQLRAHAAAHPKTHVASEALQVHRAMPDAVAMPQVIYELSRVATEEHVSVDSIAPEAATPYSGYESIPITVIVSGKFFSVQGFLKELRNQVRVRSGNIFATGRLFDVQGVSLTQTTPAPAVSATLNVNAFVYSGVALQPATSATTTTSGSTT